MVKGGELRALILSYTVKISAQKEEGARVLGGGLTMLTQDHQRNRDNKSHCDHLPQG